MRASRLLSLLPDLEDSGNSKSDEITNAWVNVACWSSCETGENPMHGVRFQDTQRFKIREDSDVPRF